MTSHSIICERARLWAALAPDGALSELETRALAAHVARCHSCRAFAETVAGVSEEIRAAPLEPIQLATLPSRRRGRRTLRRVTTVGAAVAATVLVVTGAVTMTTNVDTSDPQVFPSIFFRPDLSVSLENQQEETRKVTDAKRRRAAQAARQIDVPTDIGYPGFYR